MEKQKENKKNGTPENYSDTEKEAVAGNEGIIKKHKALSLVLDPIVLSFILFILSMVWFELLYHFFAYGEFGTRIYITVVFGLVWGAIFCFITLLFPAKARFAVAVFFFVAVWFYISAQLVYFHIFGTSLSLSQFGMGADAVTTFRRELFAAVGDIWYQFIILLLPVGVLVWWHRKGQGLRGISMGWLKCLVCFVLTVAIYCGSLGFLLIGGTSAYSCYDLYHSSAVSTDLSVKGLGVMTTARLELKYMAFGSDDKLTDVLASEQKEKLSVEDIYNILKIDFNALNQGETDEDIIALNDYFASSAPTKKNEYTGYFQGYNLIELCCESFSPVFIDKELTPTLYQMYHGGFIFDNYYSPWESNTTNGEYTLCMGLFPDNSRSKSNGSFKASADNDVMFCLGNMFGAAGVNAYGYHNYKGYYYDRRETYANMGLTAKFAGAGMNFSISWPASDLEMMEQSVDDYINEPQFFAHYMTFSGHYRYERKTNAMVRQNWDKVENLPYSDAVKSYLACNLELEYALTYLTERLEKAGVADKTVIALTCDHFPYGLSLDEYSELAGYEVDDDFGKYKNAFILWTPSMTKSVKVKEPMCTVDILPTLLNLWGFPYDSRLLTGKDIFSDTSHVAILSNGSFITDKIRYDSSTGQATNLVADKQVTDSYVESWVEEVKLRFTLSTEILNNDYYRAIDEYLNGTAAVEAKDAAEPAVAPDTKNNNQSKSSNQNIPAEDY